MNDLEKEIMESLIDENISLRKESSKLNKILNIIMTKCVDFKYFHNNQTLEYYNKHVADWRQLTPDEFELLKTHYELYKNKMNEKKKENL